MNTSCPGDDKHSKCFSLKSDVNWLVMTLYNVHIHYKKKSVSSTTGQEY